MPEEKYLRQKATGRIYAWTKKLSERDDMVECSTEVVKNRIAAMKERIAMAKDELENAQPISRQLEEDSKLLRQLEEEYAEVQEKIAEKRKPEEEEVPEDEKPETEEELLKAEIEKDPEIIKIKDMTDIKDIVIYIKSEYGEKIDLRKLKPEDIESVREKALELRAARIMEK